MCFIFYGFHFISRNFFCCCHFLFTVVLYVIFNCLFSHRGFPLSQFLFCRFYFLSFFFVIILLHAFLGTFIGFNTQLPKYNEFLIHRRFLSLLFSISCCFLNFVVFIKFVICISSFVRVGVVSCFLDYCFVFIVVSIRFPLKDMSFFFYIVVLF